MHLVGFIIRIYHDALSPERQIRLYIAKIYKYTAVTDVHIALQTYTKVATVNQLYLYTYLTFCHKIYYFLTKFSLKKAFMRRNMQQYVVK